MPPESQPRPRRADAERNRALLVGAAKRLFDEAGTAVPFDDVARAAGVANATLYRHFATRAELLVAVYADEVAALDALSERLAKRKDPDRALGEWLRAFVEHVATKRDLALAVPDEPGGERTAHFDAWHDTMHHAAQRLLTRAQDAGAARRDVDVADLLALVAAVAVSGRPDPNPLLTLVRTGYLRR